MGLRELHVPPDWQVMVLDPVNVYPLLHTNVTVLPTWYCPLVGETNRPLAGTVGVEQVAAAVSTNLIRCRPSKDFNVYIDPF